MTRILSSSTARVIGLLAVGMLFSSCFGEGGDQLSGMYDLSFPSTAVCNSQVKMVPFRNVSGAEIVIEGAAMSVGTDPDRNFYLESIVIEAEEIASTGGTLTDIHIPAGADYYFKIRYSPRAENTSYSAVLDIAYSAPREGIIQVQLQGTSAGRASSCNSGDGGGPVDLQGDLFFHVTKMVAAASPLGSSLLSTDQGKEDFSEPDLPLTLTITDAAGGLGMATFPAISGSDFFIPIPGAKAPPDIRSAEIEQPTVITTLGSAQGPYDPSQGSLTLENVPVQMSGTFQAKLTISLTTETVKDSFNPAAPTNALALLGSLWDPATHELHGQRINSSEGNSLIVVGIAKPVDVIASGKLEHMEGSTMAVIIYGNIVKKPSP